MFQPPQDREPAAASRLSFDREIEVLRAIVEYAPEGLVVVDRQGRFLFFNPAARKIVGIGLVDVEPRRWAQAYGLHDLDGTLLEPRQIPLVQALRGESVSDRRLVVRNAERPSGLVISVNAEPLKDRRHETIGAMASFRDISAAYRATGVKNSLTMAVEYRDLIDNLHEGLWVTDATGTTLFVNPQMARMIGYRVEEIVGRPLFDFVDENDRGKFNQKTARRRLGVKEDYELNLVSKSARTVPTMMQASPLFDRNGRYKGSLSGVLDISRLKAMTSELEASHEQLEQTVARRTAELRAALEDVHSLKEQLESENVTLREQILKPTCSRRIVGSSPAVEVVHRQISRVAPTDSSVLLLGETGTGKGLFAKNIHRRSRLADEPFITVDCATLAPTLIESTLFGHEKGAFTGADSASAGRFELADGGTLFLDEIGEVPLDLQVKLLRFLQSGEFERVGSTRTRRVKVRVVAATNRDLSAMVRDERFRSDLYFRISVFPIRIPPLRERLDDLPELVSYLVERKRHVVRRRIDGVAPSVHELFRRYDWPGNVRELENIVERALILARGRRIEPEDVRGVLPGGTSGEAEMDPGFAPGSLRENERLFLLRALRESNWVIKGPGNAAERLGLAPSTLRDRMSKLGIEMPGKK